MPYEAHTDPPCVAHPRHHRAGDVRPERPPRARPRLRQRLLLLHAVGLLVLPAAPSARAQQGTRFQVIVHESNGLNEASGTTISRLFLKKQTQWPDGLPVRPIDLPLGSPVREAFTSTVHRRSVSGVESYWQRQIFSGRDIPPPTADDEEEVLSYVRAHVGAIGYVSTKARLDGVKALQVEGGAEDAR